MRVELEPPPAVGKREGVGLNQRILLVEQGDGSGEPVVGNLEGVGFEVTSERGLGSALELVRRGAFDAIVVDGEGGVEPAELCRLVRLETRVPLVVVSGNGKVSQVVKALDAGADDYIRKPVEAEEVVARVCAVLRRVAPEANESVLSVGDLEIDAFAFRVRRNGEELSLTATEFRLLLELARHAGQVLSRQVMLDRVWGYDYLGDSRLVDMAIKRLRDKIEEDPRFPTRITTVRGIGYRLERL